MTNPPLEKDDYSRLSRLMFLLLNRAMMYKADHPHIKEAILNLHQAMNTLSSRFSNLVLIMTRDQMFLDEEPVDARINTSRIIALFKKTGLQSISFSAGVSDGELKMLIEVLTAPELYPDSDKMTEALNSQGAQNLKINHVFYKKMTRDDEVVSRGNRFRITSSTPGEDGYDYSNQFMKILVEGVLAEETGKTLSLKNLLDDPAGISKSMLSTESKSMQTAAAGERADNSAGQIGENTAGITPGAALLYQVRVLSDDVHQKIESDDQVNMMDVADALREMKHQLSVGIEAQKALNQAFANEKTILDQMDELTDSVVIKLIKNEYQQGTITTTRLAQILRRLIPEADALKRLLPKIKAALLAEGMPMAEYLQLVHHLGKELENEGLTQILAEAAESVGVEGEELIEEIRKNPQRAAELMTIAAEIRKGTDDENAFTEMLIDYVEALTDKVREDGFADDGKDDDQTDRRQMVANMGSGLVARLKEMNFSNDALLGMEERINARIEDVLEKMASGKAQIAHLQAEPSAPEKTLLEMLEESAGENEDLKRALSSIRAGAEKRRIDENNFEQIYLDLIEQERALFVQEGKRPLPPGVLRYQDFKFYLKKELLRAKRYNMPLSTLSFILLNVRLHDPGQTDIKIRKSDVIDAAYRKLIDITRGSDIIGELDPETMIVILPMAGKDNADLALKRITQILNDHIFDLSGIRMSFTVAGSVAAFLPHMKPDIDAFIRSISYELKHTALRMRKASRLA